MLRKSTSLANFAIRSACFAHYWTLAHSVTCIGMSWCVSAATAAITISKKATRNLEAVVREGVERYAYRSNTIREQSLTIPVVLLIFVVAGTMGLGFAEIGGGLWSAVLNMLRSVGVLSKQ